jgi:hypothetical protein
MFSMLPISSDKQPRSFYMVTCWVMKSLFHWCLLAHRQCNERKSSHMSTFLSWTRPLMYWYTWISEELKSCDRGGQLLGNSLIVQRLHCCFPCRGAQSCWEYIHALVFKHTPSRRPVSSYPKNRIDYICQLYIKKNGPMSSLPIISGQTLAKTDNGNSLTTHRVDSHRCGFPISLVSE